MQLTVDILIIIQIVIFSQKKDSKYESVVSLDSAIEAEINKVDNKMIDPFEGIWRQKTMDWNDFKNWFSNKSFITCINLILVSMVLNLMPVFYIKWPNNFIFYRAE